MDVHLGVSETGPLRFGGEAEGLGKMTGMFAFTRNWQELLDSCLLPLTDTPEHRDLVVSV